VFLDNLTGQIVWFKFLRHETSWDYQEGLDYLENRGFEILSVTIDGRRGLSKIFHKYPYQVCQIHIQRGISTLLTKSPRSDAGRDLNYINKNFIKYKLTEQELGKTLSVYTKIHQEYLNEPSESDPAKPKHQRLFKALKKYKNNMKYLFTYQSHKDFKNTTNDLDGGLFSPLKQLLNNHRGMTKERRKKLIILYFNRRNYTS
jgi:hypothetical protein